MTTVIVTEAALIILKDADVAAVTKAAIAVLKKVALLALTKAAVTQVALYMKKKKM